MSVDVVGAILRIVFEDEDGGVVPVGAMGIGVDDAAERPGRCRRPMLRRGFPGRVPPV